MKNCKKRASSTLYLIVFLIMFFIFLAFAIDGSIVLTNRAKLQNAAEVCALAGASEFNYDIDAINGTIDEDKIIDVVTKTFALFQSRGLDKIDITNPLMFKVDVNTGEKKVSVTVNMIAAPYFLSFFGVTGINLSAKASAKSEALDVTANYSGINWLTSSSSYLSDIITNSTNLHDTAILLPLGMFPSASYDKTSEQVIFNLIESSGGNSPLSLGPGGFITIKLPVPIINKPGPDLYIKEAGSAIEGYMVFAGIDNDPDETTDDSASTGPYFNYEKPGAGISWKNITCSGTPEAEDPSNQLGAYTLFTSMMGLQTRFFGSGYFDLGASCVGNISMVKYIRIVDDNQEEGFVHNNDNFYKAKFYGEASTTTSGADIDQITVLNHVKIVHEN